MERLADAVSPDVARGATVLVPVGSVEQHGPHLPLDTDTVIARAVAERLAPLVEGVVAPALTYGASGEHQHFPGTVSIGTDALVTTLVELGRSLSTWAGRVVFVNGHGGNLVALERAVALLRAEGRRAVWVPCAVAGADAHAGRTETSLMLFLDPSRVRLDRAEAGNTEPLGRLMPRLRTHGVGAVSANGVLGDPEGANAPEGDRLVQEMVRRAHARVSVSHEHHTDGFTP
ncbi:mycofactocin biosynthesis peptidyl-dipeptidase MftE [Streptomyces sp. NPDC004237]|uniref:mycofactocin biosynthesis peptidyl-dipeptidase MftE n=1 Tax=Streptomyces sp. NPDC004237 TaxID=3154455 RepID=UPI0033B4235F